MVYWKLIVGGGGDYSGRGILFIVRNDFVRRVVRIEKWSYEMVVDIGGRIFFFLS